MSYFAPQVAIRFFLTLYRTYGPGGTILSSGEGSIPGNALTTITSDPIVTIDTNDYITVI